VGRVELAGGGGQWWRSVVEVCNFRSHARNSPPSCPRTPRDAPFEPWGCATPGAFERCIYRLVGPRSARVASERAQTHARSIHHTAHHTPTALTLVTRRHRAPVCPETHRSNRGAALRPARSNGASTGSWDHDRHELRAREHRLTRAPSTTLPTTPPPPSLS